MKNSTTNSSAALLDTLATRGIASYLTDLSDAYEVSYSDWIDKAKVQRGELRATACFRKGELVVNGDEQLAEELKGLLTLLF